MTAFVEQTCPKLKTLIELFDFTRLATTLDEILLHASKKANTLENPNEEYLIKLRGTLPGIDEKRKKARYLLALRFHENLMAQELLKQLNGNMQPDILTTTMEVDMKKVQGKKSEFASLLMNLLFPALPTKNESVSKTNKPTLEEIKNTKIIGGMRNSTGTMHFDIP